MRDDYHLSTGCLLLTNIPGTSRQQVCPSWRLVCEMVDGVSLDSSATITNRITAPTPPGFEDASDAKESDNEALNNG